MATETSDIVIGSEGPDVLSGAGGADTITGGGGDDVVYGFGAADEEPASGLIAVDRIATGFTGSLFAASPPGEPERLMVVEQGGRIVGFDLATNTRDTAAFLTIPPGQLSLGGERGLLGLAFHPDYAANGRFYVHLTIPDGDIEIREYTRGPGGTADPASMRLILSVEHSAAGNHNGGWVGFGPDGLLYIAVGDGGGGGDPENDAQNRDSLLGKILRVDVNRDDFPGDAARNYGVPAGNPFVGVAGADEVFALGLRNPFRASFDRATGDFYIADVGQDAREEVDFLAAGTGAGANFGWHIREGDVNYDTNTPGNPAPTDPALVAPVAVYDHTRPQGGFSITGGYAYRGAGGLQGQYVFADFITNNLYTVLVDDGRGVDLTRRNDQLQVSGGTLNQIASFAEDGTGRLYAVGLDGELFRLTPSTAASDGGDLIEGGAGADRLYGGAGADRLSGGADADFARGGIGADIVDGSDGDDVLVGDDGDDTLYGGQGSDLMLGTAGADTLFGGAGDDAMGGQTGADTLYGEAGSDTLYGNEGDDVLFGMDDNDALYGGDGNDAMGGQAGDDGFSGGRGADVLYGGDGRDVFYYQAADHSPDAPGTFDTIADFQVFTDRLDLRQARLGASDTYTTVVAAEGLYVLVDLGGEGTTDMRILLAGIGGVAEGDILF